MERVNKETGELSASGELSVSVELDVKKAVVPCLDPLPSDLLREQLHQLQIDQCSSLDHDGDPAPLEERHEHLVRVLPLYIQVLTRLTGTYSLSLACQYAKCMKELLLYRNVSSLSGVKKHCFKG